jgi:glutathione S-transferase
VRIWRPANFPNLFLLALPLIAVTAGWGLGVTAVALFAGLGWKWTLTLRRTARAAHRDRRPLVLETIAASHYVEKARWCMDLLGLEYRETASVGVLGVIFTGRSVPRLRVGEGHGSSLIGDSSDILRYLWAEYGATDPAGAAFLEPSPAAVELERHIDAYGAHIRRWFYFGALPARDFMLRVWGVDDERLPRWQRWLLAVAYPGVAAFIRRALGVDPERTRASVQRVEAFLTEIEDLLADERRGLLGHGRNYVDYAFAALSGLWLPCPGYGGGAAEGYLPPPGDWPATLREDMVRWRERFPRVVAFVEGLYNTERQRPAPTPTDGPDS